jgi:hypothetical protein
MCYILCMCVCGCVRLTTASDDPNFLFFVCVCIGRFPRGVPGGGRYAPPGYASSFGVAGASPKIFFWGFFSILADFCYF